MERCGTDHSVASGFDVSWPVLHKRDRQDRPTLLSGQPLCRTHSSGGGSGSSGRKRAHRGGKTARTQTHFSGI